MSDPNYPFHPGDPQQSGEPYHAASSTSESLPQPVPAFFRPPDTCRDQQSYNVLAIVALILAFVTAVGGIVCGHIALSQIRRTGQAGHGLALAATVLGYVFTGLTIVWFVIITVVVLGLISGSTTATPV